MNKKQFFIFIIGAAGLFLALQFIKLGSITIRLPGDNYKIIHLIPVDEGDRFSLTYHHSVEKTLVKGIFQVSGVPSILAVETRMTSVGTGLPNTFSKRTSRDGKWIVVDEEKKEIDNFRFFISRVNNTYLTTPGGTIDLMTLPSGTVIVVGVEEISLIRYLFYKCKEFVAVQLELQTVPEASEVRFEGRHKPVHGGLTVAVRATDTLKSNF